jgi:hypothetical protein
MTASFRLCGALALVAVAVGASARADAPAGRYTVAGGTVTDNKTKLVWQQTAPSSIYPWVGVGGSAKDYCQTLGATLSGPGWRLPTIKELQTIVDESRSRPSIDLSAFPMAPAAVFWSSSLVAGSSSAWAVDFGDGSTIKIVLGMGRLNAVRCVR